MAGFAGAIKLPFRKLNSILWEHGGAPLIGPTSMSA
jgi:hypothetical protein